MGDVALTVPVLWAFAQQYPKARITLITREHFAPLFRGLDIDFVFPDLYGKHKGVVGLYRLFRELKSKNSWDVVVDLHDVLRTKILRFFFRLNNIPISVIDKGRKEKKALTARQNKVLKPLKHTTVRYANVFEQAGFPIDLTNKSAFKSAFSLSEELAQAYGEKNQQKWIGIAPFAKHEPKMYPLEKMTEVIDVLIQDGHKIFLLGGGKKEKNLAHEICKTRPKLVNTIGKHTLEDELGLLSRLDVVLTMDSANMHMASLTGTQVVSIWGATHPFAGFSAFGQNDTHAVQISADELPCRPCSVFGNKPCHRGDHACMMGIAPETIVSRMGQVQ